MMSTLLCRCRQAAHAPHQRCSVFILFQGCLGIAGSLLPVVRGTVVVATAAASGGGADRSRLLQRSRSVTSQYRRSVSQGASRSHLPTSSTITDHDQGPTQRMPPPPVITYSGASVCCTPTDDRSPSSSANQTSPTWPHTSPDSPSDALLGPGGGYTLQASSPSRSVTVTPLGSFLAINQPPAEFCESMLNIEGSSDCTSAGKPINFTSAQVWRPTNVTTYYDTRKKNVQNTH